jgi:hypothetical protein
VPKEAVFTLKLEPELRDAFMAEAEADHRPASQVVRELMREYIQRRRQQRERAGIPATNGEPASASTAAGPDRPNEGAAQAELPARRAGAADQT